MQGWFITLFVHALHGNLAKPEEMTILMYAEEIAPPYQAINEKKAPDTVKNCAQSLSRTLLVSFCLTMFVAQPVM